MQRNFYLLVCWFSISCAAPGFSQDLHFSQFYQNPLHLSPALAGIFRGEIRASAIYRNQWRSVPVNYQTFGAALDGKALRRGLFTVNGGLLLQSDRAGDGGLSWTQAEILGSVAHALGEKQAISAGFGLGFVQRTVDFSNLKFKNQWTGEVFDPNLDAREAALATNSGFAPTLSAGLNWHFEPAETEGRTHFDAALGGQHLNRPNLNFDKNDDFQLPIRLTINAFGHWKMNDWLDLAFGAAAQQMGKNREILATGGIRRWLKNTPGHRTAVQFSLIFRPGDAVAPALQIEQNGWSAGFSYDWNTSGFEAATGGRGGPEISLVWRLVKPEPVKTFKVCPIFEP